MTDIIIKSFNRPYYLARCLESIYALVSGSFQISILDDGTPAAYLEKIQSRYPEVRIIRSALYQQKATAIAAHLHQQKPFDLFSIPVDLWKNQVGQSSPVFLLLEDDIWMTEPVDLEDLTVTMAKQHMVVAKIGWSGNANVNQGKIVALSASLEAIEPQLPIQSSAVYEALSENKFKIRSVLYRLGLVTDQFNLPYYALYAVAAAFFEKNYWLSLWDNAGAQVNESRQLGKALNWKNQHSESSFGKTTKELSKTSYISSATNNFPGVAVDMIVLNHYLNEAWLAGSLDAMNNFPKDFDVSYLKTFLEAAKDERCSPAAWDQWITCFKNQYIKLGCDVE